jgi:phosphoribosylformylglycinamidine cyclo-ligase
MISVLFVSNSGLTYKDAGVDIDAGEALVDRIKGRLAGQSRKGILGGVGGFASLISLKELAGDLEDPILVSGTDGVGTKLAVAFGTGRHDTVGIDLVAMCVNDVITCGARPLFFLDYFATGKLDVDVADQVVGGIAEGCRRAECTLVGGETAEMPGLYSPGEYDLAGFTVGVVDRKDIIDGRDVKVGDVILGIASRGLHSNGYSLARHALLEHAKLPLEGALADALLEPTAIYVDRIRTLLETTRPKAMAHITGGGIVENLPRVLPKNVTAKINKDSWPKPDIFEQIRVAGDVPESEMYRTFNMGIGYIIVVSAQDVEPALQSLADSGNDTVYQVGEIVEGEGSAKVEWSP